MAIFVFIFTMKRNQKPSLSARQSVHLMLGSLRGLQAFREAWLRVFLLPNLVHARPHAGNANRWAELYWQLSLTITILFSVGR